MVVVVGVAAGIVTGTFASLGASGLYATGLWARNGPSTLSPGALDGLSASTQPSASSTLSNPSSSVALPWRVIC